MQTKYYDKQLKNSTLTATQCAEFLKDVQELQRLAWKLREALWDADRDTVHPHRVGPIGLAFDTARRGHAIQELNELEYLLQHRLEIAGGETP